MKYLKNIFAGMVCVAALFSAALSCTGNGSGSDAVDISGEWHLSSVSGLDMDAAGIDVYAVFCSEKSFELYQKVGEGRYYRYEGSWSVSGDRLDGVYSDGKRFGSLYSVSFGDDGNTLVLTAANGSSEVSTYVRENVPDEIRSTASYPLFKSDIGNSAGIVPFL